MRKQHLILLILSAMLTACSGSRYNVLHTADKQEIENGSMNTGVPNIQKGQELCITVTGLNEESARYFRTSKEREGATGIECLYYMVDPNGNIQMPLIGNVEIEGKSLHEAEQDLEKELDRIVKDPTVRIEYVDFHVSVLGEVEKAGVFDAPRGRITLYEAISKSGGFTQFGRRNNVLILREEGDSVKHIRVDLTDEQVWNTEYYFLQSNDVVMVSSNSGRIANSKNMTSIGSILVGLGTVAAILVTR